MTGTRMLMTASVAVLLLGIGAAGCCFDGTCRDERFTRTYIYRPAETVYVYSQPVYASPPTVYAPAPAPQPAPPAVVVQPAPYPPRPEVVIVPRAVPCPPPQYVVVNPIPCPPPTYVVTERYYAPYRESAVAPSIVAGALIGAGTAHHSWRGAGRGALIGAGVGILLDVFHR